MCWSCCCSDISPCYEGKGAASCISYQSNQQIESGLLVQLDHCKFIDKLPQSLDLHFPDPTKVSKKLH